MHFLLILLAIVFLVVFGIFVYLFYIFIQKRFPMANYPLPLYRFIVNWGGTRTDFTEVSGLDVEVDSIRHRSGSSLEDHVSVMPGLESFKNIILRRGVIKGDNDFFLWLNTKQGNTIERRDITISLLDENRNPAVTWKVKNAFPVRYSGPKLHAIGNDVAIEELEIVHEGFVVEHH